MWATRYHTSCLNHLDAMDVFLYLQKRYNTPCPSSPGWFVLLIQHIPGCPLFSLPSLSVLHPCVQGYNMAIICAVCSTIDLLSDIDVPQGCHPATYPWALLQKLHGFLEGCQLHHGTQLGLMNLEIMSQCGNYIR